MVSATQIPADPKADLRRLEGPILDARNMAALLTLAYEDTLGRKGCSIEESVREAADMPEGYVLRILTTEQSDSLDFAVGHIGTLTHAVWSAYEEATGTEEART